MEKTSPDIVQSVQDLARIGAPATEYLVLALNDEDKRVKIAAAKALGDIGDRRCVEYLVTTLGDHDKDVRFTSAIALGKVGDQRAVEPLTRTCMDENCFVRIAAREALARVHENIRK
jgi:HEAT repeat protein